MRRGTATGIVPVADTRHHHEHARTDRDTHALARSVARAAPLAVSFVTMFFAAGQLVGPVAAGALIGEADRFRLTFGLSTAFILAAGALALSLLHGRIRPGVAPPA